MALLYTPLRAARARCHRPGESHSEKSEPRRDARFTHNSVIDVHEEYSDGSEPVMAPLPSTPLRMAARSLTSQEESHWQNMWSTHK